MWGIIPAAGAGSRIQPLAFSKELLPVGSQICDGQERPRAVSEYLVERMILGGANKLCFVISPGKGDILEYYGGGQVNSASFIFVVQPQPAAGAPAFQRRPAAALPGSEDSASPADGRGSARPGLPEPEPGSPRAAGPPRSGSGWLRTSGRWPGAAEAGAAG